jgi:hypothetical protein
MKHGVIVETMMISRTEKTCIFNPDGVFGIHSAPKIHGELQKLGFELAERTVARHLRRIRRRGNSEQRWLTFLKNHREVIVAFDLFTVPTLTFQLLYCFFVIEHGRRRILHFNVTRHPTADWIVQQLREAFPDALPSRYAVFDHDSKFDADVIAFLKATGGKGGCITTIFVFADCKGRIICGDQSATGHSFPMGCVGRLNVADGTPAPDRKQQHRVDRHERALRSFAQVTTRLRSRAGDLGGACAGMI